MNKKKTQVVKKLSLRQRKYKKFKKSIQICYWLENLVQGHFPLGIIMAIYNTLRRSYKCMMSNDRLNKMFANCSCVYVYLDMTESFD